MPPKLSTLIPYDQKPVIQIRPFQISSKTIKPGSFVVVQGPRNKGKTVFTLHLMRYLGEKTRVVVMAGNGDIDQTYGKRVGNLFVHTCWSETILETIYKEQEDLRRDYEAGVLQYGEEHMKGKEPYCILVLDDVAERKFMNTNVMLRLAQKGRHAFITVILLVQYVTNIPPPLRANLDWIFLVRNTHKSLTIAHDEYAHEYFDDYNDFLQCLKSITRTVGRLMCINCTADEIQNGVFYYQTDIRVKTDKWHCGDRIQRKVHHEFNVNPLIASMERAKRKYDPEYIEEERHALPKAKHRYVMAPPESAPGV